MGGGGLGSVCTLRSPFVAYNSLKTAPRCFAVHNWGAHVRGVPPCITGEHMCEVFRRA